MSKAFSLLICCIGAVLLPGCASVTRYGDTRLVRSPQVPFWLKAVDPLEFPATSLAKVATYRYQVLDLPKPIYPHEFSLRVAGRDRQAPTAGHFPPWAQCVVRASLLSVDGHTFFSRTFRLGEANRAFWTEAKAVFTFAADTPEGRVDLPPHRSYTLQIEVLRPSDRRADSLRVEAYTQL